MYFQPISILAFASATIAHMHLHYPPTLKGNNNPNTVGEADRYLNYPYGCCGQAVPGPCKGHLDLLDTDEGKPVVTWSAGQKVNFTLSGEKVTSNADEPVGGTHYGGSCQVGFSVDKGQTFKVATTWQGNCPLRQGTTDPSTQSFDFTVPADIPAGERVLFAWTWVNREKEFNMNCASVTIANGKDDNQQQNPPASSASSQKPSATATSAPQESSASAKQPSTTATAPAQGEPSATQPASSQPTDPAQYTLDGCTCSCPYQTWSAECACYSCKSPTTKRHLVARKALEMHKRHLQNAEKLNAPLRRAEAVAFNSRPNMLLSIDFAGAKCSSTKTSSELEFPDPGPDVVTGDGEYKLDAPTC